MPTASSILTLISSSGVAGGFFGRLHAMSWHRFPRPERFISFCVVRRAKEGASYQVKDLLFQNLASRNYRVLQLC